MYEIHFVCDEKGLGSVEYKKVETLLARYRLFLLRNPGL